MSTAALEKKVSDLSRLLNRVVERDSWMTKEKFQEKTGFTDKQVEHLHKSHPELFRWKSSDKVDTMGRTVRRGALINIDDFYALYKSAGKA